MYFIDFSEPLNRLQRAARVSEGCKFCSSVKPIRQSHNMSTKVNILYTWIFSSQQISSVLPVSPLLLLLWVASTQLTAGFLTSGPLFFLNLIAWWWVATDSTLFPTSPPLGPTLLLSLSLFLSFLPRCYLSLRSRPVRLAVCNHRWKSNIRW